MPDVLAVVAVFAFFAAVIAGLVVAGFRTRRRRRATGSAVLGPFEEIWHPAAHRARLAAEAAEERVLPMQTPDGPPRQD
ncbi:MAG TPA: hypothetical protein VH561_08765 [Micromonosporaceae bacterium]|jgi:hypothetical protein